MKKILLKFLLDNKEFFVGLILTLSLFWPLFAAPYFSHHDDVQVIRLYEMDKCIKDKQIPCRWVPDLGGLYGYPLFNYYAPLPYYFGEIVYQISGNLIFSSKIIFAASFLGAYIFMYLLAKKFWGKLGGSASAIFYSFAPYHALDFYARGAMGEMWGLMFFPGILWALTKLEEKFSIGNVLLLALFIAGLLTSHNLSALMFAPVLAVWLVTLFLKKRNIKFVLLGTGGVVFGILLSAFYLFPVLVEKNLVHVDTTTYGYFGYTEHFKGLRELVIDREWGWGSSIREIPGAEKEKISFQIGWIHILGLALSIYAAWILWKKKKWEYLIIATSVGLALAAAFMIHPRSEPIWKLWEALKYLQFPWRWLLIVILLTSFLAGSIVLALEKKKVVYGIWIVMVSLVVLYSFSFFRPEKFIQTSDKELLMGANWDKQIKRSIFDYLPIYAKEPPAELAGSRYEILTGESVISDFKEGSNWLSFKTDTKSHTIIRLSQYYFPNWKIFVDGKEVKVEYADNSLGLMTIILGEGKHEVYGKLYDTQIRVLSNTVTLFTAGLLFLLFVFQFKRTHEWIKYYRRAIN